MAEHEPPPGERPGGGPGTAEQIARRLTDGIRALRQGQTALAADLLEVCVDPAWIAAADLADLRCRALSLSAQALWQSGRIDEALRRAEAALALARQLGDLEGVHEIGGLHAQIAATPRPIAPFARASGPEGSLQAAAAAIDRGDLAHGLLLAEEAITRAGGYETGVVRDVRVAVLARLIAARADPARAEALVREAAEIARDAEEPTLLGAAARAAALHRIDLDTLKGPEPVRRPPAERPPR